MPSLTRPIFARAATCATLSLVIASCRPDDGVADPESARRAYLGLDRAVDRAIKLGFDGFNAASNANIPEQMAAGDLSGTVVVGGKVDQGASNNKEMDLQVTLTDYSDGPVEDMFDVAYDGGPALLDLSLRDLPNGTFTGSFSGEFAMTGELAGTVALDLDVMGQTEEAPDGTIRRKVGTIHVTGTATSDYGVFAIDISL
ncbi:hypothetical protein SAMN02745121_05227 [Nannocystis exedens]|uniref:Uncharacterized protein n=1 Tax=Nannocystis exedens TaxID=54 RepID=A0A1I2CS71_9BACT|nr:hypothetical protein NAEX_01540 [Nannocystis exedens]SFE71189.1 hypothetical protein SAMN02745121_05227 [Nannocystis exedens]